MGMDEFARQIDALRRRVAALREPSPKTVIRLEELAPEVFEALDAALGELGVAEQELRQQNAALGEALEALEAERRRYQELFEFAPDAYFVTDEAGIIREANRAASVLLNVPQKFLVGKPLVDFVPTDDRPAFRSELLALEHRSPLQEWEVRLQPRHGRPFPGAVTVAEIRDLEGRPVGRRWQIRDLTERRRAEEERKRLLAEAPQAARHTAEAAEQQVTTILESITDAFYVLDREWRFTYLNPAAEQLVGRSVADLIGKNVWEEFPGTTELRLYREYHRAMAERVEVEVEEYYPPLDTWFWVRAFPSEIGLAVYFRDVTERKRAEQQALLLARGQAAHQRVAFLAEASARLAASLDYGAILASLTEIIVPELADCCAVDLIENDGSVRRLGGIMADPARADMAHDLNRWFPPDLGAPHVVAEVLRTGQARLVPTISHERLSAAVGGDVERLRFLQGLGLSSVMIVPMVARGRTLGAIIFVATESGRCYGAAELALAEELAGRAALAIDNARLYCEAQHAIELRDRFLSIASHELKTPLTALQGYAGLVLHRVQQAGRLGRRDRSALEAIHKQAARLGDLIDLLTDFSSLQTGHLTITSAPLDLGALVYQVARTIQLALERHTLDLSAPREPLMVEGDEMRLEQVVRNLIDNAVKYSPQGGPVTVRVERQDGRARLAVSDEGIGIPSEALPQLFAPFYRAGNAQRCHAAGVGLGLHVVREVVALHGGTIEVESKEGEGSTFTVSLPLLSA